MRDLLVLWPLRFIHQVRQVLAQIAEHTSATEAFAAFLEHVVTARVLHLHAAWSSVEDDFLVELLFVRLEVVTMLTLEPHLSLFVSLLNELRQLCHFVR